MNEGTRFGRTVIVAVVGDLVDQNVDALVHPANSRGLIGTASPRSLRILGGVEIERDAMEQAPLELGSAILTGPGQLADSGVRGVIHAVVQPTLGSPVKLDTVRRAVRAALEVADANRFRSIAMPTMGAGAGVEGREPTLVWQAIVEEIVAYLRRTTTRLNRIVLVSRFEDDIANITAVSARARERLWNRPV
jgi:O-acetyl-ADP-ribose deacetylase (regulator of RNase III)